MEEAKNMEQDEDERAHEWALQHREEPHDGEYVETCELCRQAENRFLDSYDPIN